MTPPRAVLYAEWEAVIAAVIYGVEAAAQVSLALCVCILTLRGAAGVLKRVWR